MRFYMSPGSSSLAVHVTLLETGADFETVVLSFSARDHRDPAFLAINPEGKVPTLVVDGRVLTEVAGILFYLARRHPEAGLLPEGDVLAEAEVVSWMSFLASTVHPARRAGPEAALDVWRRVDSRLAGRTHAVGDRHSIADIHLFRLFWRYRNAVGLAPGTLPNVEAHAARVSARPAVGAAIAAEEAIGFDFPA